MDAAPFRDRRDAGRRLSLPLERLRSEGPVIVALPRGGVPIALELAEALAAPLDLLAVRALGPPGRVVGAVAEGGIAIVDHDRAREFGLSANALTVLRACAAEAAAEAGDRLRGGGPHLGVVGRTVVLVEDGQVAPAAVIAAARTVRHRGAARIVLATPVRAPAHVGADVDEVICLEASAPDPLYEDGTLPSEAEIIAALRRGDQAWHEARVPEAARGVVLLAGGGDLIRGTLDAMGFATLSVPRADGDALVAAASRLRASAASAHLPLGMLGVGPAAPVVLAAAAEADAVVVAGARADEMPASPAVPTLLIVGGEDHLAVRRAREAGAGSEVAVVAGASRAFTEPGALEQLAHLAGGWFARHLGG